MQHQNIKKLSYFLTIFNSNFNIGFGSPRTDVCSTCLELGERIKVEQDATKKHTLQTKLEVHKIRAKAFFSFLKEVRKRLLILSVDCQKNEPVLKLPDQAAYYSRQLYVYNLTIVARSSKSELSKENVYSYVWTKEEFLKGSNEISSVSSLTFT